jgi:protein-S-isoprenylcysteine O-methyltransferase Ste14
MGSGKTKERRSLKRWLKSTSRRTFVVYPLLLVPLELLLGRGGFTIVPYGLPLLVWGYLQYRLVGRYRTERGGGGPGIEIPPDRIVEAGPYRYVRNPMYLGHLIFMAGLAITLWSWPALALLAFHIVWFHQRVVEDEVRLQERFGPAYTDYTRRVKRWIPGVI